MAKKMFVPARLSVKKDRWEIVFYQTGPDGVRRRFRETRELNRIKDLKARQKQAVREIQAINKALPDGYPFQTAAPSMTVREAAEKARDFKIRKTEKEESRRTYKSQFAVFDDFLSYSKLGGLPVDDFGRGHGRLFADYLLHERVSKKRRDKTTKGVSNKKVNDYMASLASFWNELIERELVEKNPFEKFKRLKTAPTERRCFTDAERSAVFEWLWAHDRRLYYAAKLQYSCLIRGTALRELRFFHFNFSDGLIELPGKIEKSGRPTCKTIPESLLPIFQALEFCDFPRNWLVFGENLMPNASKKATRNDLNRRLQDAFLKMRAAGLIGETDGLTFYSNKNTGITEMLDTLPLVDVMNQAGHKDPSSTMIYYRRPKIIAGVRQWDAKPF